MEKKKESMKNKSIVITVPEDLYDKIKDAGSDFGMTAPAFVKMVVSKTLRISDIFSDLNLDSKRGRSAPPGRVR